ncbi:ribonuclease H-like domain-containing protein [Tanacetum coccineum]
MVNCNPSRTLVDTESKLGIDGDSFSDPTLYQSLADLVAYSDADWAGCPTTRCSTSEAEYRGVANVVAETFQHQRMKHIEIDIHFVHDLVVAGQVRVLHVTSRYRIPKNLLDRVLQLHYSFSLPERLKADNTVPL